MAQAAGRYDLRGAVSHSDSSQPRQTSPEVEAKVLECSLSHPSWGCVKLSDFLKLEGISVSSPTIQKILIRNDLASVYDRWLKIEERHLSEGLELSASQIAQIEKFNPCFKERHKERHVEPNVPESF